MTTTTAAPMSPPPPPRTHKRTAPEMDTPPPPQRGRVKTRPVPPEMGQDLRRVCCTRLEPYYIFLKFTLHITVLGPKTTVYRCFWPMYFLFTMNKKNSACFTWKYILRHKLASKKVRKIT